MTLCCPAQGQEQDEGPRKESTRIVLVVDVSGSMRGDKLRDAIMAAGNVAVGPLDDLEVGVITFTDTPTVLTGPQEGGWFLVPTDARVLIDSLESLAAGGDTNPDAALSLAFAAERTASVVFITDGIFSAGATPAAAVLAAQQTLREAGKPLPHFVIMGTRCSAAGRDRLSSIARQTGGQIWTPAGRPVREEKSNPADSKKKPDRAPRIKVPKLPKLPR